MGTHTHTHTHVHSVVPMLYHKDSKNRVSPQMQFHKWPSGNKINSQNHMQNFAYMRLCTFFEKRGLLLWSHSHEGLWSKTSKTIVAVLGANHHYTETLFAGIMCSWPLTCRVLKRYLMDIELHLQENILWVPEMMEKCHTRKSDIHKTEKSILVQLL